MTDHLGYEENAREGRDGGNSRNGKTRKRVKTGESEHEIEVPRDREVVPRFLWKFSDVASGCGFTA